MKKIVILIVVFIFLFSFSVLVVLARGDKPDETETGEMKKEEKKAEPETITVLMGIDAAGKHMGDRAVDFEKETGIKVNMIEVEWDTMVNKQSVALTAREPTYDIVNCGSFMLPEYVPGGLYDDISDLFPPDVKAKYMEGIVDAVSIEGKVYAAPLMASWVIMFYNSVMFEEAGLDPNKPPKTWDELVEYGKALGSPTTYAIADSLAPGEYINVAFFRWAKSAGAQIHEWKDGKVHWLLNEPEAIEAVNFMKSMMDDGTMDPGSATYFQQQLADLFGKGHTSMFVNWDIMQLAFNDPEQSLYAGKIFAAPIPGIREGVYGSIEGHEFMAIPTPSLHKDAARKFIKYVTSIENVRRRAIEQGMSPVYTKLFEDPEVKKALPLDAIYNAAVNCYYRPAIPEYTEVSDIISAELQNILINNKDPMKALTAANDKANTLAGW
jgi:multiple sugar transport system substrate-binding protein